MQTRTGSTRLPGKSLKKICGKTVTELIIERVKTMNVSDIVAAIPEREEESFVRLLESADAKVFKGSEDDVLSRFHGAVSAFPADIIVRINGDNLLVHPEFVNQAIHLIREKEADYVNVVGAPVGCGVDVFIKHALEKSFSLHDLTSVEKEHVIPVFFRNGLFKRDSVFVSGKLARGEIRLTLDTKEDFALLEKLYGVFYKPGSIVPLEKVIDYLDAYPDILSINKNVRQKGWK